MVSTTLPGRPLVSPLLAINQAFASPVTGHYTLGGDTTGSGPYTMTSTDATYNVLRFIFDTPTTFANLSTLSVDYDAVAAGITDNDGIADSLFDVDTLREQCARATARDANGLRAEGSL